MREPEKKAQAIASPPVTAAATQTNPAVKAPQAPKIQPVKPKPRAIRKRPTQTARMNNSLDDLLLGTSPSMSAQESDSGSSIRGLSPISQTYATSRHIPEQALESLRAMETFQVSPGELKRFLEEGNLRQ